MDAMVHFLSAYHLPNRCHFMIRVRREFIAGQSPWLRWPLPVLTVTRGRRGSRPLCPRSHAMQCNGEPVFAYIWELFSCYRVTSIEVLGQSSAVGNTSSLEVSGLTWLAVGVRRGAESPGSPWLTLFQPRFPGTPYLLGVMGGEEVCIRADCPYVVRVMEAGGSMANLGT